MDMNLPQNRISKRALPVWRLTGILRSLVYWVIVIVGSVFVIIKDFSKWWIIGSGVVVLMITALLTLIIPRVRWERWRYELREQEIEFQYGLFIVTRTLVPMVRVQHVDTVQGPILRKYGLATLMISTAATVHEIPAIDMYEADELRKSISTLARVAEDDV